MAHSVTIPGEPVRHRITGLPRFVHVKGGGYFFLPGIWALRFLASEPSAAQAPSPQDSSSGDGFQ